MSVRRVSGILVRGLLTTVLFAMGCGDNRTKNPVDAALPSDGAVDETPSDTLVRQDGDEDGDEEGAPGDAGDAAINAGDALADGAGGDVDSGPTCSDGVHNGDEVDVDCGGACAACAIGRACRSGVDCASGACNAGHVCVECFTAANCPGQDSECGVRACVGSACVVGLVAAGTVLPTQTPGDCRSRRCDGAGQVTLVTDDDDLPDDGNPCTRDLCASGTPSNPPAASSTACGAGRLCDGSGHCVGCLSGTDCPGTDDECRVRSCVQNLCGFTFRANGTAVATQIAGDCKISRCDGAGHVTPTSDDADLPIDGNACTDDVCASGVAANPNRAVGTACIGGGKCDSGGRCVACVTASDCPGPDTACRKRTCVQGACRFDTVARGTTVVAQKPGDCKVLVCDDGGLAVSMADDTDRPVDGNACTADVCTAGAPSNPPLPEMTACGGSNQCDGAATAWAA